MSRRLVARANTVVFGVLVAILLLVCGLVWEQINAVRGVRAATEHSYAVLGALKNLNLALRQAETGQRGFLLTGRDDYLAPYKAAVDEVATLQGVVTRLTIDNAAQQERLRTLQPRIEHKLGEMAATIQLRRDAGLEAALRVVGTDVGREDMRAIEALLQSLLNEEQDLLAVRTSEADGRATLVRDLTGLVILVALVAMLVAARILTNAWRAASALEAEQRLQAMRLRGTLDSLSQGIGVFAADQTLQDWNGCFPALLDLPDALLRRGQGYAALAAHTAEAGRPALEREDALQPYPGAGGPVIVERERADGHHLEIRRTAVPDGGFVLTVSDLTARVQAENILRQAQKMQAIGQLTGGIAHDFNNLLQVILGNLEIVRAKLPDDPKLDRRIERAAWAAQRGATLTAQLLAFARRQPLAPAAIDLAAGLPDLLPLLRRTLGEHIDIRPVQAADLWPAMADAAQLESALLNLALNARDAMPGGGRLTIELANCPVDAETASRHAELRPGDYVTLAVSDTGHGMTPDVLARVFEPFFTTKPDGKGTGLGLAMVFGYAKQSRGHVTIASEPGEGTTVRLYLPRAELAAVASPRGGASPDLPRGTATILVVEDEAAVREIAVAILADLGYRVLDASDGEEGLRVFGEHAAAVDLLLTDLVLPGKLRGREMAERVRAVRPGVRVVFMSGYTDGVLLHHGPLGEGEHLIGKPFKREDLARKVADVLGQGGKAAPVEGGNVVGLSPRRAG